MARTNQIKESAEGLALQVTIPARNADLVVEDSEGNPTRLHEVLVYGFDDLLLVVGRELVSVAHRAELVASAARDTESIHHGETASIATAGNGYQVQLPGCRAAGFSPGVKAPVSSERGLLAIHDGTQHRLARDLATIRSEQVSR